MVGAAVPADPFLSLLSSSLVGEAGVELLPDGPLRRAPAVALPDGVGARDGLGVGEGVVAGVGAGVGEGVVADVGAGVGEGVVAGVGAGVGEDVVAGAGAGVVEDEASVISASISASRDSSASIPASRDWSISVLACAAAAAKRSASRRKDFAKAAIIVSGL